MPPGKRSAGSDDPRTPTRRPATERSVTDPSLKRVKAAIQQRRAARLARDELVLSSVDDFRRHVVDHETLQQPSPDLDVVVTGLLLWKSTHTYGESKFVRLHLTDAAPEETIEELAEFEDLYGSSAEDRAIVDAVLLTATLAGLLLGSDVVR